MAPAERELEEKQHEEEEKQKGRSSMRTMVLAPCLASRAQLGGRGVGRRRGSCHIIVIKIV